MENTITLHAVPEDDHWLIQLRRPHQHDARCRQGCATETDTATDTRFWFRTPEAAENAATRVELDETVIWWDSQP